MSAINAPLATGIQSRIVNMTISRELVAIVILSVGFGSVVMIGVEITGERAAIHDLAHRNSLQATKLLATVVATGVRWRQSDTIERSYQSFLEEAQTEGIGTPQANNDANPSEAGVRTVAQRLDNRR